LAKESPQTISLIGAGALGTNLLVALAKKGFNIGQVLSRNPDSSDALVAEMRKGRRILTPKELEPDNDFVFITVPDRVVDDVVREVIAYRSPHTTYLHCSGSAGMNVLAPLGDKIGVLYPMQAFSRQRRIPFTDIPIFVEGMPEVQPRVRILAHTLSRSVKWLDSNERRRLHIGAVFAANFTNYMIRCAGEVVEGIPGVDYRTYMPLIREVIDRLGTLSPAEAQTGPARRADQQVILAHFEYLRKKDVRLAFIYELVSRYIMESHKENEPPLS